MRFLASLFSAFAKHRFSKPLRYLTKLVLAKPFHRNSRHFFSLPCQCIRSKTLPLRRGPFRRLSVASHILSMQRPCCSSHFFASPFHCQTNQRLAFAFLCHALPLLRTSRPCSAFALPVCASQCRRDAVGRSALPLHSSSPHSLRHASSCTAFAEHRDAKPSHGQSNSALPLPSRASRRLRESGPSMPCRCSQAFTS